VRATVAANAYRHHVVTCSTGDAIRPLDVAARHLSNW
jgi:hypothetical protein